jgi:hypothetical protein
VATDENVDGASNWFCATTDRRQAESRMLMRWFLFETGLGQWILALLERHVRLAVVSADWLAVQPCGQPKAEAESRSVPSPCPAQE